MSRFSRIRQGAQLNQAFTNYQNYLATPRVPNLNSQGPRDLSLIVYVVPFKMDVAADEVASARMNPAHYTRLSPYVNAAGTGAQVTDTLGANSVVSMNKFSAARLVYNHNNTRIVSTPTSRFTQQRYLKYDTDRFSCPFGRNLENDDEGDAFLAAKAALLAAETGEIRRVSWTRENVGIEV
jgi:hypothetical protein